ncbi:hypothetical protein JCM19235_1319 [Vibrio maritimus]|uniref:Uncharacterized protein n=1 Tax=Vibrio maritimus TaxID=990268 RepID=A0A090S8B9_9VIBR|nr:hypothetical protein JCM19235_1319 [Vibrio maritimus]
MESRNKALVAICNRINDYEAFRRSYKLSSICNAPVVDRNDRYQTSPLLEGEYFRFGSVRPGKSKRIIFRMRPATPQTYRYAEFNDQNIAECFPELMDDLEKILGTDFETYLDNYESFHKEQQQKEEAEIQSAVYGTSWGMFG